MLQKNERESIFFFLFNLWSSFSPLLTIQELLVEMVEFDPSEFINVDSRHLIWLWMKPIIL